MGNKIRILHIDDNFHDRQIVKDILQKEPDEFEITDTDNHLEFNFHLNKSDFDLILSEYNIPGLEGLNVLQIVKEKKPEIPVIIVTGKGSEEIATEAIKLGAADYVIKSEKHIRNLSPTIRKVIENRKIQDDHKATLIALRKSEEHFRLLFNNSLDAVFLNVPDGDILEANTTACNIFGRTEEGLKQVGRNGIIDVTDPRLAIVLEERSRTGKCNGELTGLRKDGTPFPIEISSVLFQDNDGNLRSSMVIRDITERKRAEKSLQESENLYRNLFESMLNGFAYCKMIFDQKSPLDFIYLKVNTAFESLTGLSNVVGKKVSEVIPGIRESDTELFEIYGRVALTGKPETFEIYVESLKLWFLISVYSPQKEYFVAIFDVITNRKLANELLVASEIRYRRLFESAKDGILILDAESGMIVDVNPFLVELLGYSTEQFHGKKIWEIGLFSDIIANQSKFLELQQKEYVRYDDLPLKTSDGGQIAVEFVSNVYEVNQQKVIHCTIRNITERKKLEEQRIVQTTALESTAISVVITDAEGTITWVNSAFTLLTGFSKEEAIGKNPRILKSGMLDESVYKNMWNTIKAGFVWRGEIINKRKDNSLYSEEITITPVRDKAGIVRNFIALKQDITERKKAEEQQIIQTTALEATATGVVITDAEGSITWVNNAFTMVTGYNKEEAIGKNPRILKSGMHDELFYKNMWNTVKAGNVWRGEIINKRKDNSLLNDEMTITPVRGKNGVIQNFIALKQDITERKNIQKALKESEIKLRFLLENSADAIFITDSKGKFIYINKAVTDLLGYSSEEMLCKTIVDVSPEDKIEYYFEILTEILSKGKAFKEIELLKKDGNYVSVDLNSVLLPDGLVYGSCRDITERRQAETEIQNLNTNLELKVEERTKKLSEVNINLIKAKAQAEKANKSKSEFLSNMSHEIRTPMNAILGYAELLSNILEDKTQKDYLKSIMSSGKTLLTLINDILDLSKIEAGKLELAFDYVNTHSFFSEFEPIFSWKLAEKGLAFILDIVSGVPSGIYIDETRLRQIILNIMGNAVKFTQKGHIKLKVFIENPQIVKLSNEKTEDFIDLIIEIEDTGIGISKEFQNQIFKPFSQEQHKNQFGGTGLGLAITRRLLDLMNGTIQVKSKLKKGTTFQIRIPDIAYLSDFERTSYSFQIDSGSVLFKKATLLIVDDISHNRKYFVDALKNTNIEIIEAEDGLSAYHLAKVIIPDLIITDLHMPKLDGFGLLKKIQGNPKLSHIPVIAYSASVMKEQKEHVFNCKFSGLLIKPVGVTDLYIEIMNYLPYTSIPALETDLQTQKGLLEEIIDIQGLINSLETVYTDVWKKFEVRQPMDEVREFGENIENLGKVHNAEIFKKYGNELMLAAESFNIESILKLLNKYQGIVKDIKDYQTNN